MRKCGRCKIGIGLVLDWIGRSFFLSARAFFFFIKNRQNLCSKAIGYAFVNHLPLK